MLIFDAYRITVRTFHALFKKRPAAAPANETMPPPVVARTGLFSTPISAGLITGALAAGINLIPLTFGNLNYFTHPFLIFFDLTATVYILCSGPFLISFSRRCLKGLLPFSMFIAFGASLPTILIYQAQMIFAYRHFFPLELTLRIFGTVLIGRRLARTYCASLSRWKGAQFALLGNILMLCFEAYASWRWETGNRSALDFSRDQLAFYLMAIVISQIGVATLPALAAEHELRRSVTVPPAPEPSRLSPTSAPPASFPTPQ